jgi:predicted 2-oxoglutarate/Fe(II)-dependent dioxygenase YbiX
MSLRDGVLVRRNAVGSDDLAELARYVSGAERVDSAVSDFEADTDGGEVDWVVNKQVRDTQHVKLTKAIERRLRAIDDRSIASIINPYYAVEVCDREPPQILHYGVGGHYIPHVDAETLYKDDMGLALWEKTLDRDLSVVYFINDDFEGGELFFPELDLVIEPEAGTLVCFPSDDRSLPVTVTPSSPGCASPACRRWKRSTRCGWTNTTGSGRSRSSSRRAWARGAA